MQIPLYPHFSALRSRIKMVREVLGPIGCHPWKKLCLFDVGANDGSTFGDMPRLLPWCSVYAFEPTPELVLRIRERFGGHKNFHLIPSAVGEVPGTAKFNVAGQGDWGSSSLLEFSSGLEQTWPGRTDFKVTTQIEVKVIRLDTFIQEQGIKEIDFLHIDTQGTDLSVLRSLGEEIRCVSAGAIEVPQRGEVMLYKGQHTREQALDFLSKNKFKVWKIVSQQNEENLFFRRK